MRQGYRYTLLLIILLAGFLFPYKVHSQTVEYFKDRLLIKYVSEEKMAEARSKISGNPQTAVEQFLRMNGAHDIQPMISQLSADRLRAKTTRTAGALLRIREVRFNREIDPVQLAAKVSTMPGVEYAEPKYIRRLQYLPDDDIIEKYVNYHRFDDAWDISRGSADVVIAIVDGGVGYLHRDLDDKMWINDDEIPSSVRTQIDSNSDGRTTSTEVKQYLQDNANDYNGDGSINLEDGLHEDSDLTTGTDTDDNGFVDDIYGWDFWSSGGTDGEPVLSDNNPIHENPGTDHGTHVTGIAAAETDNGQDIAGTGFDVRYMAVKAGGTPDQQNIIGFGFEGMVYAADQGADVINCSWGGGGFSQAELDVIEYVVDQGALVVAASGNQSNDGVAFPAAYAPVLSVGSVVTSDQIAEYSNYGYNLDVLATGSNIRSTSYDDDLDENSGTSMATPVVSGLAGLLKSYRPGWSPLRIASQIRATAENISNSNAGSFSNKLGKGKVDAFRALDTNLPGVRVISHRFENTDGEKLGLDQDGSLYVTVTNVGNAAGNLDFSIQSLVGQGIELGNTSVAQGTFSNGDTTEISFDLTISSEFDLDQTPTFRIDFTDNSGYEDFAVVQYDKLLYDIMDINNVKTSFAADGTIGYTDPINGTGGVGFIPRSSAEDEFLNSNNILFEGGLMIEIDGRIHDAVRATDGNLSRDFTPEQVFYLENLEVTDRQHGRGFFRIGQDTNATATIEKQTFAYDDPQLSNVVYVKYTVQNPSSFVVLDDMYLGLFNDWDIGINVSNNTAGFSEADSTLYMFDATENSTQPFVAVAHLGPVSGALAIDNTIEGSRDSLTFGLYDGFTNSEKSTSLKAGTVKTSAQNTDASVVVASGPYTLNPNAAVTVGFVYAFGSNLDELQSQIQNARSNVPFAVSPTGLALPDDIPTQTKLFQNYPNPFRQTTRFRIDLETSTHVTLTIYDVLGRRIKTLFDSELEARTHIIPFNAGDLSSGVYFARLKTEDGIQSIPMTLVK